MIARSPISVLLHSEKKDEKVILIFHMMKISIKSNSIMNHARVSFYGDAHAATAGSCPASGV